MKYMDSHFEGKIKYAYNTISSILNKNQSIDQIKYQNNRLSFH